MLDPSLQQKITGILSCVGQTSEVVISSVRGDATGYHTQMSVVGTLEKHPADENDFLYRVVRGPCYVYFTAADVTLFDCARPEKMPTIFLSFEAK